MQTQTEVCNCNFCGRKFQKCDGMVRHIGLRHLNVTYLLASRCSCGQVFPNDSSASTHFLARHGNDEEFDDEIQDIYLHMTLQCEFCGASFSDMDSLLSHSSKHCPAEGFSCDKCTVKSMTLEKVFEHRSSCSKKKNYLEKLEKAFVCNVCRKEFVHLKALIEHR